jgi:serine/threonine protein kinase
LIIRIKLAKIFSECGQSRPHARYSTAPNDVWSLGVILVNLTCGRNPWKKASPEDSTFRAFLRDPGFLASILPISPELNTILQYVFESDPRHRIGLDELRALILACPRFTTTGYDEPSSPLASIYDFVTPADSPISSGTPVDVQTGSWPTFEPTSKQSSFSSENSSDSGYDSDAYSEASSPIVQPFNFYGNVIPFPDGEKSILYPNNASPHITSF